MRFILSLVSLLGAALASTPVMAQDASPAPPPVGPANDLFKETVTIGVGAASVPSYEGSDSNRIIPAGAARGTIHGYYFSTRAAKLYVDAIRNKPGPTFDFQLGPVVSINTNRSSRTSIKDVQVAALGRRKTAVELGGFVGFGKTGVLTSDYDTLTADISYIHDVSGIHDSYVVTPQIYYATPLSRKSYVGLAVNASYAGNGYARTYFGVNAPGALRSGLPTYDARGGWKNYSISALGNYSITGDLTHGISVAGGVSYSRLLGHFRDSPVTSIAGSANQLYGALGLAYTF